jgi:PKD repeat protein
MKLTATLFMILATWAVVGQNHTHSHGEPCGTQQAYETLYEKFPEVEIMRDELIENSMRVSSTGDTVLIVPVVFHILHEYGPENISKQRILNEVDRMNLYFKKLNADTTQIVPAFQGLIGNANIEFRLATKDPSGNCTDGINRIATNEARIGDFASKLAQWAPNRYLNIYTAQLATSGSGGTSPGIVLAYATFPGTIWWQDGILSRADAVYGGGFDDGWTMNHEVGHYFGLSHPWGNGQVDTECGDDGIPDTPVTEGNFSCNLNQDECNPGVIENVQNFMDYASCGLPQMFTLDQAERMRTELLNNRPLMYTAENLAWTGTDVTTPVVCTPKADFNNTRVFACVGDNISFSDESSRANNYTLEWIFHDGSPATSTSPNPVVTFNTPGWKMVTLIASNSVGSDTIVKKAVHISPNYAVLGPNHVESFEDAQGYWWKAENFLFNEQEFEIGFNGASDGSKSMQLINFYNVDPTKPFPSYDAMYYFRLGERVDRVVSPGYDLSLLQNGTLEFDWSYATNGATTTDITAQLRVFSSNNCGQTWIPRTTISGPDLVTAGNQSLNNFKPDASDWETESFSINNLAGDGQVMFMFQFTSGDKSNNFYLDNIRISGTVGVDENTIANNLKVYPNPANEVLNIEIPYVNGNETLRIFNSMGQLIYEGQAQTNVTQMQVNVADWAKGVYQIEWVAQNNTLTSRFIR